MLHNLVRDNIKKVQLFGLFYVIMIIGDSMKETENIKAITNFLFIEDDTDKLKPSDLVIVLCNNNIDGIAKKIDELFRLKVINDKSQIIISGKHGVLNNFNDEEAVMVQRKLTDEYGYSADMFTLEKEATNIYENLSYSKKLVDDINKYKHILLIGVSSAMRRIKLCATGLGYPIDKIQLAGMIDFKKRNCDKNNWWKNERARIRIYQELERIGKYLIKGDLDIH